MKLLLIFITFNLLVACNSKTTGSKVEAAKQAIAAEAGDHDEPCDGPDAIEKKIKEIEEKAKKENAFSLTKGADEGCAEDE